MGDIKTNIANNISFYRKKSGLTQSQLADKMGVKTTTVSTWERNASSPDIETLYGMCNLFGISLDEMYGVNTEYGYGSEEPTYEDTKKLIARNGKALSTEQKMELIKLLTEIIK